MKKFRLLLLDANVVIVLCKLGLWDRVPITEVAAFLALFKPLYLGELDPGEAESLAYLVNATEPHFLCSADKIVFRVLGALNRENQGLSLERLLQQIGLTAGKLGQEFSETYRLHWTRKGQQEAFLGPALR